MNRVIKFRGKRLDNGEWVYGYYVYYIHPECGYPSPSIIYHLPNCGNMIIAVNHFTVGQYIGLKDRNGKEIYEGDIITVGGNCHRVIHWNTVSWAMIPCELYNDMHFWRMNILHPGEYWDKFADEMEVVGNIHDNPEFLKSNSK